MKSNTPASPSTPSRRVLIVEDETLVGLALRNNLERLGHVVVAQADDAQNAIELFRKHTPELVLVDIRLGSGGVDGIELASKLMAERRCPMIILSAYSDPELHARASAAGVFGYLVKPASPESLGAQIEVAFARFTELQDLADENTDLRQTLETRKLVERAKGILMKRLNLSEPEAHKRLQTESQKRRIGLAEISKTLIDSEDLLGG